MKALIFGANGQDGYYLTNLLKKKGVTVIGTSRNSGDIIGDISDFSFVESIIKNHQPNYIFHLAAISTANHNALFDNHKAISTGTLNVLESVRLWCRHAKVFLSGSALQFKNDGNPIDELTPFDASSAYSVARIQSVYAGRYFRSTFGLQVYCGYFFHHDSPLRSFAHVNQKIVKTVNQIANGTAKTLELGNIDVRKEFNYAGDIVEAIWILVNQTDLFEAVIGSGKSYSIKDWTEYCFKKIDRNYEDYLVVKKDFVPEYKTLVSNPQLIKSIGWEPRISFEQLADLMMASV